MKILAKPIVILALAVAWAVFAYSHGLTGSFIFDDHPNITQNGMVALNNLNLTELTRVWSSGIASPLGRPIAMLSFGFNLYFFGMDPWWFKAVNIGIHVLTGLSIFWLTWSIRRAIRLNYRVKLPLWMPAILAAYWLIHPFNLTPVLYVVQRMAALAALFTILALAIYAVGRLKLMAGRNGWPWIIVAFLGGTLLAAGSKETGLLLPWLIIAIEWFVFQFQTYRPRDGITLRRLSRLLIVVPIIAMVAMLAVWPEILTQGYGARNFNAVERLMTQARVLWIFAGQTLVPNVASMGLFHDDVAISRGLLTPWTTGIAMLGVLGAGVGALWLRRTAPLVGLGLMIYLIGHSMESGPVPLEMIHEHRNYFPSFGLLLAFIGGLTQPAITNRLSRVIPLLIVILMILYATALWIRADIWGDQSRLLVSHVLNHPESARSRYELGRYYALLYSIHPEKPEQLFESAMATLREAQALDRHSVAPPAAIVLLHWFGGKTADAADIQAIEEAMRVSSHIPISPTTMGTLLNCIRKPTCPISRDDTSRILDAALSNPKLVDHIRAQWLSLLARFQVEANQDYENGIRNLRESVALSPADPRHKHNLLHFLVLTGKFEEARETLNDYERGGHLKAIRRSTDQLTSFLDSVEDEKLSVHEINRRWLEFSRDHSGSERITPPGVHPPAYPGSQS